MFFNADYALRRMRYWLRGSVSVTAMLIAVSPQEAAAQAASRAASESQLVFDIPAQDLNSAILVFAQKAKIRVFYDTARLQGKRSPGVHGMMTPPLALAQLLDGTGVPYNFTGPAAVTIGRQEVGRSAAVSEPGSVALDTVDVQGVLDNPNAVLGNPPRVYAGGQVANGGQLGMLGNRSILNTPFSQTSYTKKVIQDQQARQIQDVLANDPSVRSTTPANDGNSQFSVRGFPILNGEFGLNGIYGVAPFVPTVEFLERVEVLKGPSALLNGMPPSGSIGGSINLVTKRATDEPITQFNENFVSRGTFKEHLDIGRRFGQDNAMGVRFNGAYYHGYTNLYPQKIQQGIAALGIDLRLDRIRASLDVGYQDGSLIELPRFASVGATVTGMLAAPDASRIYMPHGSYGRTKDLFGLLKMEADITDRITAFGSFGLHDFSSDVLYSTPSISSLSGAYSALPGNFNTSIAYVTGETGVRSHFDTGPVEHQLTVSASRLEQTMGTGYNYGTTFAGNIYYQTGVSYPVIPMIDTRRSSVTTLSSVGVADTLSAFDKRVQLTLGVRRQEVGVDSYNTTTAALSSGYDKGAWSPAYALVVKPWEHVSLYANYIEGLQKGTIVTTPYANAGDVLPPYVSKQIETGVKAEWGTLMTTLAFFEITQPNTITTTSGAASYLRLDGRQRNRGIELSTAGELTPGIRVLGGMSYIDGRQIATAGGANNGKKALGVPEVQLNLGAEWDTPFLPGFTLNGRVIYTGGQFVNATNTVSIPDWTRLDVGARYTFAAPWNGNPMVVRFNVENLLNKSYWASVNTGALGLGAPRTFLLSTTMNF